MGKPREELLEKIKNIPEKPGIYKMKDRDGNIIYVGKSKNLKSRIRSYFNTQHTYKKVHQMMFHIYDIDVIPTDTHLEARILECALIKKIKPIYNKEFKNDKKYAYLKVGENPRTKPLTIVYERLGENCIGPFRSKNKLLDVITGLQNIYPIMKKDGKYEFEYRVLPCPMERKVFEENRKALLEILFKEEGMKDFISQIKNKMEYAAVKQEYEMASKYRELIGDLNYINSLAREREYEDREILIGEKIDYCYKLFYVFSSRLVYKRKYSEINKGIIDSFIKRGRELIIKGKGILDEKRELDFKRILISEINDSREKVVAVIGKDFMADLFANSLVNLKNNKDLKKFEGFYE